MNRGYNGADKENLRAMLANKALRPCVLMFAMPGDQMVKDWISGKADHPGRIHQAMFAEVAGMLASQLNLNRGLTLSGYLGTVIPKLMAEIKKTVLADDVETAKQAILDRAVTKEKMTAPMESIELKSETANLDDCF